MVKRVVTWIEGLDVSTQYKEENGIPKIDPNCSKAPLDLNEEPSLEKII